MCVSIGHFNFFHSTTNAEITNLTKYNLDVLAISGDKRLYNDLMLDGYITKSLSDQSEDGSMSYYWVKEGGKVTGRQLPWLKIEINQHSIWTAAIDEIFEGTFPMPEKISDQDIVALFQAEDRKGKITARAGKMRETLDFDILEHSSATVHLPTAPPYTLKILQKHIL